MTLPTKCIFHVSNWYLKTCRKKARKTLQNPKKKYSPKFRNTNLSWFIRPRLQKLSWLTFGCYLSQIDPIVEKLEFYMSCHLLNANTKFQNDISKHVEKSPEYSDGRTDDQAGRRTNIVTAKYVRFSNGRMKTVHFCILLCSGEILVAIFVGKINAVAMINTFSPGLAILIITRVS